MALERSTKVVILIAVIGWLGGSVALVWSASADRATLISRVDVVEKDFTKVAADHEQRIRAIEKALAETAGDVRWLRQYFDPQARQTAGTAKP